MRRPFALAAAAAGAALLAAGCGSSSSSTTKSAAAPATNAAAQATTTAASAPASGGGVAITTKHASKLGTILAAGPKHMTVYLWEADNGGASACSGACAKAWPPVTTTGQPSVSGSASAADLGTITRPDGTKQVTYKGHPLYFFIKDGDSGDAYGQGSKAFGAGWYVLSPSGSKVDNS